MSKRPTLNKEMDREIFESYYYLKEELVSFCRANGLPTSGGKIELTNRIAYYLETGERLSIKPISKPKPIVRHIEENQEIEQYFVCSETHRAFFKEKIGKSFSFNVTFQQWLKGNSGRTYAEAIEAYHLIMKEKKNGKTTIDKQFEYNTYIRDFFADNEGYALSDAITCWKYKKGLKGHNRYERVDLAALKF